MSRGGRQRPIRRAVTASPLDGRRRRQAGACGGWPSSRRVRAGAECVLRGRRQGCTAGRPSELDLAGGGCGAGHEVVRDVVEELDV
ncbi:hypothetical protein DMP15_18605 [Pseudonocardia sp. UM4_GMWB1]